MNQIFNNTHFQFGLDSENIINPLKNAAQTTATYVVIIALYIWLSGEYVSELSTSVTELAYFELYKGFVFVFVTGVVLFIYTYFLYEKIKKREQLIRSQNQSIIATERLVMAGIFSSSVCHDINNILTVIVANIELLRSNLNVADSQKQRIDDIFSASESIRQLTQRVLDAGRGYIPGEKNKVDIVKLIKDVTKFAQIHKKMKNSEVQLHLPESLEVSINATLFTRTLMNLIINAAEAGGGQSTIAINVIPSAKNVKIEVHDDGQGIPEENKSKIMEPFFTTKKEGNGLGLLSLKTFAQQHNAEIHITKSRLGGACFSITLEKS